MGGRFADLPVEILPEVAELEGAAAVGFVLAKGHHAPQVVDVRLPGAEVLPIHWQRKQFKSTHVET